MEKIRLVMVNHSDFGWDGKWDKSVQYVFADKADAKQWLEEHDDDIYNDYFVGR